MKRLLIAVVLCGGFVAAFGETYDMKSYQWLPLSGIARLQVVITIPDKEFRDSAGIEESEIMKYVIGDMKILGMITVADSLDRLEIVVDGIQIDRDRFAVSLSHRIERAAVMMKDVVNTVQESGPTPVVSSEVGLRLLDRAGNVTVLEVNGIYVLTRNNLVGAINKEIDKYLVALSSRMIMK